MPNLTGLLGVVAILGLAVLFSTNRRAIQPRIVLWGLGMQLALALFILKTPWGSALFAKLGEGVTKILDYSKEGATFIFGSLAQADSFGFIFAFQVLPAIVFVGALMGVLYYLGIMQAVISAIAKVMVKTMGTSGAESLSAVGTVFVGQSEAPLLIKPYVAKMTKSELMAVMTGGMATIAGSVMAAYIGMLGSQWAPHLLAASIMGAPAGLVLAKILVPETETPETKGGASLSMEKTEANVIEAAAKGAGDGLHLALIVGGMLIAFIALVAMLNGALGLVHLSMQQVLGWVFAPFAFLLGVPWSEAPIVGNLLGSKLILNEFVAYAQLSDIIKGAANAPHLSKGSITIATFALCGFANLSSIAINLGCLGGIAPERRGELAGLGVRAMLAGAMATCMTGAIAGLLL